MRRFLALALVVVAPLAVTAAAAGLAPGLRYCKRPGGPGNYLAASAGVTCSTARKVELKVISRSCYTRSRCQAYGFTCLSYWDGRYGQPFSDTHHAVCRAGTRRIEMDEG